MRGIPVYFSYKWRCAARLRVELAVWSYVVHIYTSYFECFVNTLYSILYRKACWEAGIDFNNNKPYHITVQ